MNWLNTFIIRNVLGIDNLQTFSCWVMVKFKSSLPNYETWKSDYFWPVCDKFDDTILIIIKKPIARIVNSYNYSKPARKIKMHDEHWQK